jgi:hypothetical protein
MISVLRLNIRANGKEEAEAAWVLLVKREPAGVSWGEVALRTSPSSGQATTGS